MINNTNSLLRCFALCLLSTPLAHAASIPYTLGKNGAIEVVSVFSGEASGNNNGVEGSLSADLKLKIASKSYDLIGLESKAELEGVGKGTAVVKGGIFGWKRIFLRYPSKDTEDEKGTISFPYYARDLNLPQARMLVGVVPFKLQPNVTLKIDGAVKSEITRSPNGGGEASLTFQPIRASANVGLDFSVGVEVLQAKLRGEAKAFGLSANIHGKYYEKADCSRGGSYRIFGALDGPEGKVTFVAKVPLGKKNYEVEKELWKLPDPESDAENNVKFVLAKGDFNFSNQYDFKCEVVGTKDGEYYSINLGDGSRPVMQARRWEKVGAIEQSRLAVCENLQGPDPTLVIDGVHHGISGDGDVRQIKAYDVSPKKIVYSDNYGTYYESSITRGEGTFNVKTGDINITYVETLDLTWTLGPQVSTSTLKEVWTGKRRLQP